MAARGPADLHACTVESTKRAAHERDGDQLGPTRKHAEIQYRYLTFTTDDNDTLPGYLSPEDQVRVQAALPRPELSQYSDPQSWPLHRKSFVTWLSCVSTFVTTFTPGAYAAGTPQYEQTWGISTTAVYAGITLFTLCFAIAPMFLASLSELTGRRPLFIAAGVVFVVSQAGTGVTASFAGLLVTRALAGMSCSVFSTVVGGVISDLYDTNDRNTAMAIFTGTALSGSGVGPMVGGVIADHLSWRWIFYVQTISCGIVVAALIAFFPETRGSVLLSRKARVLNAWYEEAEHMIDCTSAGYKAPVEEGVKEAESGQPRPQLYGPVRWRVKADEEQPSWTAVVKTSSLRPIQLLVGESVVFWFSLWMGFAWAILYLTFEVVPQIFARSYDFSPQASGLCFLAVVVASIIATAAAIWQEHLLGSRIPGFAQRRGQPENRLVFACGQSLLLPAGLFWLGASAHPSVPWAVPVLAIGCLIFGIFSVYLAVFNYLADTYNVYASSAIAAQAFVRNVFAACLPLATVPMLDSLGITGTGCLLGGISLGLSVVPWVLVVWGPRIRRRSLIASSAFS